VVMSKGRVEQIDSPKRIYETPRNEWVANFIGKANLFNGTYLGNCVVKFNDLEFKVVDQAVRKFNAKVPIKFMIRPEDIQIVKLGRGFINARVTEVIYKGLMYTVRAKWKGTIISIESIGQVNVGTQIGLKWASNVVHVMLDVMKRSPNEFTI
jgi:spermidine/putrescine transport system ATP-binding protein